VAKARSVFVCGDCRQQVSRWVGRCPGCDAWGTIEASTTGASATSGPLPILTLDPRATGEDRVPVGLAGLDRVLGGGLVAGSVVLLAGEPGIGKSTLLLHALASLSAQGRACLLVSGEESGDQVASRARRVGLAVDAVSFAPGRDLQAVIDVARTSRPFVLAVDSIQTIRDPEASHVAGGISQVRTAGDALVGLAKAEGISVLATGHVTKDGDLAGPRALEHAVDVVLTFEGDPRSGLRVLTGGKNRFGTEGESAWFEMGPRGLREIDPSDVLLSRSTEPGAAVALPRAGRRAFAIDVQALVGSADGPARRQATGVDARRFQLVAAVLDRAIGLPLARAELYAATAGGVRLEDPACDLAVAAALASAASGLAPPAGSAFVGEVALTGSVRPVPALMQRLAAARAAGCTSVFAADAPRSVPDGLRIVRVPTVREALGWALRPVENPSDRRSA
jgi:DNA repair protein RadA/Sms